jgi:hypothetical protein
MQRPYKVRFNLGKGKNYMKWKVEGPDGIRYYDPKKVEIHMTDCQLKNQRKTAEKINEGANKTVCAWVRATEIKVLWITAGPMSGNFTVKLDLESDIQLKYNPRKFPYWHIDEGVNIDNLVVGKIVTVGPRLYRIMTIMEEWKNKVGSLK